jgi:hypothetical protein
VVYARHIQLQYIYMEYTWYIQTIYLIGVPDIGLDLRLAQAEFGSLVTVTE